MKWLLTIMLLSAVAVSVSGKPDKGSAQHQSSTADHGQTTITFNNYEKPATQAETTKNDSPKWYAALKRPDWWLVIIAALTGLAIAYQAREMANATGEMRKSTKAAEDSAKAAQRTVEVMEADQRARVGATRVEITDFHPGEQSKAVLWVKNFGKSTAVNVNVEWYMEPGPERTHWHASGGNAPAVTLFPEAEFPLPIETTSPVSVDEFEAIRSGKLFLYVWGQVQYRVLDPEKPIYNGQFSFAYDHRLNQFWACGGFWNTE
jgi:hypothetical protein